MVNLLTLLLDMLPSFCLSAQQSKSMLVFLNHLIFFIFNIIYNLEDLLHESHVQLLLPNLSENVVCMDTTLTTAIKKKDKKKIKCYISGSISGRLVRWWLLSW